MAIVVFLTILTLEAIIMVPVFTRLKDNFIEARKLEAISLFQAAVDPTQYPSITKLVEIGDNLVRSTKIAGGTLISGAGEVRANFGEVPELTWMDARLSGNTARLNTEEAIFDLFVAPEDTQIPHGVILRVDVREDWEHVIRQMFDRALLSVFVALALTVVTILVVAREVVQPLARIRETVDEALNTPEKVEGWHTGISRNDEIGALARTVDQLLFLTSATITDELAASVSIIEKSPHGFLIFSEHGHIVSANAAALNLFGEDSFEALLRRDPASLFRFGGETVSAAEFAMKGPALGNGEILNGADDAFPCLVAADSVEGLDGAVLRRFLIFVDMRALVEEVRNEVSRREAAEADAAQLRRELRLLRRMFDACLVLTELNGDDVAPSRAVTVIPNEQVEAWAIRLKNEGEPSPRKLNIGKLPPILGDPPQMRRMFDTALETVRLRSTLEQPEICVDANLDNADVATFTIKEGPADGNGLPITSNTDVALLLAALAALGRHQGSVILNTVGPEEANAMSFRLKIDKTSMGFANEADSEAA